MTYVSKKEKVFDLPEHDESSSSISLNRCETRLKRFPSVSDRRAWTSEECQRYQHFYGLVNGTESSISKSSSFKYIPFDVLLAILMAEKDAYIQELLERQDENRSTCDTKANLLYKADGFEDSDDDRDALIRKDAEVVSLKNKIAGLESELEDYRDTLTKAMHKLESMDSVIKENNLLKEKIKCCEETIKCLEEKKVALEKELEYYGKKFGVSLNERKLENSHQWDGGDYEEIIRLSSERDILMQQVKDLQKDLERAKSTAAEMEVLKKISETTSSSLEEISKENESYKKKLESMKFLEKHIEELKKQAHALTEKYKRESQKANDQLKQININTIELETLREERNKLEKRVNELTTYESQYISLQAKLRQVEVIIDENDILNKKLIQLDMLESENRELKMRLEDLRCTKEQADEDKETIRHLQRAVVDQEEEIEKMLKQIQDLSQGYSDKNYIHQIQCELKEKNGKIKKYERQLMEIPILEREIDNLRNKLQKCIDDLKTDKDLLRRLQEELETCRKRCRELEEINESNSSSIRKSETEISAVSAKSLKNSCHLCKTETFEKEVNTIKIQKQERGSQSLTIEFKEKGTETFIAYVEVEKLQELEDQNTALKNQIQNLQFTLSQVNISDLEMEKLRLESLLSIKDQKIDQLNLEIDSLEKKLESYKNLEQAMSLLEERVTQLTEMNSELEKNIEQKRAVSVKIQELENCLKEEKKAREFATKTITELETKLEEEKDRRKVENTINKLQKEEANIAKQELLLDLSRALDDSKMLSRLSRKLIKELKIENKILRDMREYSEKTEKRWMKDLINKLKAEVAVLKSLSKPKIEEECELLKENITKLMRETDTLSAEISELKSALESEQKAKEYLEKELTNLQAELSACVTAGTETVRREIAAKELLVFQLQQKLSNANSEIENSHNEVRLLKDENIKLFNNYNNLKSEHKDLENELNMLLSRIEVLNGTIKSQESTLKQHSEEINTCQGIINSYKNDLLKSRESMESLQGKVKELENLAKAKEKEIERLLQMSSKAEEELKKVNLEILNGMLPEKDNECESEINYEKDLEEKYALQEALRKMENELDELKGKLKEYGEMEEEMTELRRKRDLLLDKMADFEDEIITLKEKLNEIENLKNELEELKAVQNTALDSSSKDVCEELQKLKIENQNLKEELLKVENLLDIGRKLKKTLPDNSIPSQQVEFYTPPALASPHPHEPERNEITEINFEDKIQNLKEAHAEKIKKLIEHYEKEAKCRCKSYHESINSIKSSYDSSIKKLVEKHKSSIMRLQCLHEDEVQELNTNYETQMEAMQTQNENVVNALKTESAEKCKRLVEQHNREVKELKEKYEEVIREKESKLLMEKADVGAEAMKEAHKQTLDSLTQFYQTSILELEEKHSNDLKKCKKNHMKKMELMKNKYEALLQEERKKYEEQLEEMLFQLKNGQQGDARKTDVESIVQKKCPITTPRLGFAEVLQKIINEGLESLSFEELILVHSKTCFMPEDKLELSPVIGDGCRHRVLMTAEKEELLKRIFSLEHEIVVKQLETHEAIVNMETAEKYRVQELKNALAAAQQKNNELKLLLSNQSKLQMDLKIERYMLDKQAALHETSVVEKVKELEREKAEKRRLEEELLKEKTIVKHLTASLETEKERFRTQRKRDAEYVNSIRIRLEEALNHEQMMESQLDYEARFRAKLELELQALQKNFNFLTDPPPAQMPEPKISKDIKNSEQIEIKKEEYYSKSKSKHGNKFKPPYIS